MKQYLVVIEDSGNGYSAYSPDIDGCIASGLTKEEVEREMLIAIKLHLLALKEEGYKRPEPKSYARYFEIMEDMAQHEWND